MPGKKFTMAEYYARLDEIRERYRQKPAGPAAAPATALERLRQAVLRKKLKGD